MIGRLRDGQTVKQNVWRIRSELSPRWRPRRTSLNVVLIVVLPHAPGQGHGAPHPHANP